MLLPRFRPQVGSALGLLLAVGLATACSTETGESHTASPEVTAQTGSGPDGTAVPYAATGRAPTPSSSTSMAPTPSVAPTSLAPSLATTVLTVTNAGWDSAANRLWVSGFVPDPEEGGACTLTATMGSATVSVTHDAQPDATTTTCMSVSIARDRLAPGVWRAVLVYESETRAGSATPVEIEVP